MALKKQWYDIISPKMFGEKKVGETLSADPKSIVGKKIRVSLMDLEKKYSKFFIKLIFQIESVKENKAFTKLVGHDIMTETIYRMIQRRTRRIDAILDINTKDNKKIRIKAIFVLLRRVNTSLKKSARQKASAIIREVGENAKLEDLINMIIEGELQSRIKKECNKIYPVGNVEIRKTEIIS